MQNNQSHILYIDESNISSKSGNSVYVCVYIKLINKDEISQRIIDIEKTLNIAHTHWSEMPWKLRVRFAEHIKNMDFVCKVIIYKNPIDQELTLKSFLFEILRIEDNIFKIVIDGKKSEEYQLRLKRILKNRGFRFYKIIFMDDKKEPLIRLADFVVGSFRSNLDDKNSYNNYIYGLLRHKIKILN
jgi:hypothetical protein